MDDLDSRSAMTACLSASGSLALATTIVFACAMGVAHATTEEEIQADVEEFTTRITGELRAVDSGAAEVFTRANAAREAGDFPEAERLFREVLASQPEFHHARRRLCGVVLQLGRRDEAVTLCRSALETEGTPENRASLLGALLAGDEPLTAVARAEVQRLANGLLRDGEASPLYMPMACQAATILQDISMLDGCLTRMRGDEINELEFHYFSWIRAVRNSDFGEAERSLAQARAAGLSEEDYARFMALTRQAQPLWKRYLPLALGVGGVIRLRAMFNCFSAASSRST
ncbi:MAG: tetratricopeptide repeat protein [bacterium]|nr:tetratricopeptide repeat protein [bacterium]